MGNIVIHKDNRDKGFTTLSNTILRDKRVSARAKGVFCYLVSLPPDWELYTSELSNNFAEGRDAIRNAMKELEEFGYIIKEVEKNGNLNGRVHYSINETPDRDTENRLTDSRLTENPPLLNTYNNKYLNTKDLNSNSSSVANAPSSELSNAEKSDEAKMWDSLPDNPSSSTKSKTKKSSGTQNTVCNNTSPSAKDVVTHYSERWDIMKERGYVNTDCPLQSYPQIGKLIKNSGASLEQLKTVIDAGFKSSDDIIRNNGYALKTMLSSWWVNKVLNGSVNTSKKNTPASPYELDGNTNYEENWK